MLQQKLLSAIAPIIHAAMQLFRQSFCNLSLEPSDSSLDQACRILWSPERGAQARKLGFKVVSIFQGYALPISMFALSSTQLFSSEMRPAAVFETGT